jgi:DNA-binding IclR family transcriptional regulator
MTRDLRGAEEPPSRTRIQSVSRAINLLLAVAESPNGETAKSLSKQFGLPLATTYHLLTTLWAEGMLTKDDSRTFRLGPQAGSIAEAYQRLDLVPMEWRRALKAVAKRTGETAYLGAWRNNGVEVLDRVEGAHAVRVVGLDAAFNEDVHARASGKLLLAFASEEVRRSALERSKLRRLTPHTITRRSELDREFARIREAGVAFDREEFQEGVTCVSAPLTRAGTVAACITVSAPSPRFENTETLILSALTEAVVGLPSMRAEPVQ